MVCKVTTIGCVAILACTALQTQAADAAPTANDAREATEVWRTFVNWPHPSVVQTIAQSPTGQLLVGSSNGLWRFDGTHFENLMVPHTRSVRRVLVTKDGTIFVALGAGDLGITDGGQLAPGFKEGNGGLLRIAQGETHVVLSADSAPEHWVWALAEDLNGNVWVGTEAGLYRLPPTRLTAEPILLTPNASDGRQPLVAGLSIDDTQGAPWVATSTGLYRPHTTASKLEFERVTTDIATAVVCSGQTAFAITARHVRAFPLGPSPSPPNAILDRLLQIPDPMALVSDASEGLWVGFRGRLVHWRADGTLHSLDLPDPVLVLAMTRDRENSVWVGTDGVGLLQARPSGVLNLWTKHGLVGDVGFSVMRAHDGAMWVRTNEGLLRQASPEAPFEVFRSGIELPGFTPGPMAEAPDGTVWVGAEKLLRGTAKGGFAVAPSLPQPDNRRARSLFVHASTRDLWVSWREGGGTRYLQGDTSKPGEPFGVSEGFCPGVITFMTQGPSGKVWAVGDGGITQYEGHEARCFTHQEGVPDEVLSGLVETNDGDLWVTGVGEVGLTLWRHGRAHRFGKASGVPEGGMFAVMQDKQNALWLSTDRGVLRASINELVAWATQGGKPVAVERFDGERGLRSEHALATFTPALAIAGDETIWVPTLGGLSLIAPIARQPQPNANLSIAAILVDGHALPSLASPVSIAAGARALQLQFLAPTFIAPGLLKFSHRLTTGRDSGQWSEPSSVPMALYERLEPGVHRFEVRLHQNNASFAAPPLELRVMPRLIQTLWFRCVLFCAALALLYLLHRMRTARLRERFLAVQAERARMARELHDGLAQIYLGLGYQLDGVLLALPADASTQLRSLAEGARGMLDRASAQTRAAVWSLRASMEGAALAPALERVAAEAARALNISVQVRAEAGAPPSGVIEYELPAIVLEAVTNAAKHGRARNVVVTLEVKDGLILRVSDDGVGLSAKAATANAGFGLIGMRERAARCGGTLQLQPGEAEGAVLTVRVSAEQLAALVDETR